MANVKFNRIEKLANNLREVFFNKYPKNCELNLRFILNHLNIKLFPVNKFEMEKHNIESDFFSIINKDFENKLIINEELLFKFKKFILAHAIGHFVVHRAQMTIDSFHVDKTIKEDRYIKEKEADHFAFCLLLPEKDIFKKVKKFKNLDLLLNPDDIIENLSEHYNLNSGIIIKRLIYLKII